MLFSPDSTYIIDEIIPSPGNKKDDYTIDYSTRIENMQNEVRCFPVYTNFASCVTKIFDKEKSNYSISDFILNEKMIYKMPSFAINVPPKSEILSVSKKFLLFTDLETSSELYYLDRREYNLVFTESKGKRILSMFFFNFMLNSDQKFIDIGAVLYEEQGKKFLIIENFSLKITNLHFPFFKVTVLPNFQSTTCLLYLKNCKKIKLILKKFGDRLKIVNRNKNSKNGIFCII